MKRALFGIFIFSVSITVSAFEDYNKTVTTVGAQMQFTAYFRVAEGFSQNFKFGVMYFRTDTDFGKAAYSNVLAARTSGTKLARISYTQDVDGACNMNLIEH